MNPGANNHKYQEYQSQSKHVQLSMVRGKLCTWSLRHHIMRTGVSYNCAGFLGPYYTERCSAPQKLENKQGQKLK